MIAGSLGVGSGTCLLHFQVKSLSGSVFPIYIQTDGAGTGNAIHIRLRLFLSQDQIGKSGNYPQYMLSQREIVPKNGSCS